MKFKDSDLTQIFPPEVKPVRVGLYMCIAHPDLQPHFLELKTSGAPSLPWRWDGLQWVLPISGRPAENQNQYWRGLNRDPKIIAKERGE